MMFKTMALGLALSLHTLSFAQNQYSVYVDLTSSENDQLNISIQTPSVDQDSVEYHMPKIVPGTYSISDFGRFVSEFMAKDENGNPLETQKLSDNRWLIRGAKNLNTISYKVDDTFDSQLPNKIFEPGGTNIESERDVFILNTFGIIGYLKGYDKIPFEVTLKHDADHYGATSMIANRVDDQTDVFTSDNYFNLADAPIMYSIPDTTAMTIGGAEILVSVFSPNDQLTSSQVMAEVKEILEAQKEYLGGTLPIKKYAFLIYLLDAPSNSGAFGALEHSYSSLYFLPEAGATMLAQTIRDVAAHEFFHIVTPLSIHAEQIEDFNFIEPEMSEHLWLYEGVTEYSANHVQVKYDLISQEDFLDNMREKMVNSQRFNRDLAFTEMSKNVLEKYENQYGNVYEKGALIGMCLDLELIKQSNGKYNLQKLMRDLSKEYGTNKAFKDEELFGKIGSLSHPEIETFLKTYVGGNERLPYEQVLGYAGVQFAEEREVETISLGNIGIGVNSDQQLIINNVSDMNEFGEEMGFQEGDIMLELQGTPVVLAQAQEIINDYINNTQKGDKVKMVVGRSVNGKIKEVKLKAKAITVTRVQQNVLEFVEEPTPEQLEIRNAWLKAE